jgi:hypothetical protein
LLIRKYKEKTDLFSTYTLSNDVLAIFADAYTFAAYDYMHTSNMWHKIELTLHKRFGPGGYFIYKQFLPFAGSSWNWFVESLRYSPAGLVKAIVDLNRLANQVETFANEMIGVTDLESALTNLEKYYNYNFKKKENIVYLVTEWKKNKLNIKEEN